MSKPSAWPPERTVAHRGADLVRQAAFAALLAGLFALVTPVPAAAHVAGSSGSPTNYRAEVTAIRPAAPTMGLTVGLGGQWVSVTNEGAAEIVVLGYRGEPFLRLADSRVQVNELSGTAAEIGLVPDAAAQRQADSATTAEPRWVTERDGDQATWSDARLEPPAEPAGAPAVWQLLLVVDGQQVTVAGTVERVPPPSPWPWVAALVLLAAAVSALGWRRDWHRPMVAVVTGGVLAFVLHLVGTGLAPQQGEPVYGWAGLGAVGAFAVVIGVVTVLSTVRRREAAPDRVVTTGIMVLLLAATDISVLWNSQLPFAGPEVLDRVLTVITYGVALGLLVAGVRLTRRRERPVPSPTARPGAADG